MLLLQLWRDGSIASSSRIARQELGGKLSPAIGCFIWPARTRGNLEWTNSRKFLRLIGVLWLLTVCTVSSSEQQAPSRESRRQSVLALEQEGKVAEAEKGWKSLLSSQPNDSEAYAHLGLLEARQEHYEEAIADYRRALSLNPQMPSVRLNLGLSLYKSGDFRGAIQIFEPLLRTVPKSSPEELRLVTLIGLAHYGLGEYATAVPFLKEAAARDPENIPFRLMLAHSCLWSKQYQCVLDAYREILKLNAESAEADMLMGEAYDEMKNDAGALEQFQAAVKAGPATPNVHFGYGYLLWKVLRFDEAESEFRSEVANNPEHALALAYLGDTEMRAKRFDEALPHLEHAVRNQPSIAIAHLDLGIIYGDQGHKDDALSELQTAEKLNPGDPLVHWRLGRFYQSLGQKVEAKGQFDKARNLQQAEQQSIREKLHQVDVQSEGQKADSEPK
jgi:tetratricopeptide (TPR) repeat protein